MIDRIVPIGAIVNPYGSVEAVLSTNGVPRERYYHVIDEHGTVSMIPAVDIERIYYGEEEKRD